jgi:Zn-dependent oligopeptidase
MVAFKQTQYEFHESSNRAKNASLYVDWIDGEFVAPSERITKEMLAEIVERNAEFLGYAYNHLALIRQIEKEPDAMRSLLSDVVQQVEKLGKEKPDNLRGAMETLLSSFLEQGNLQSKG